MSDKFGVATSEITGLKYKLYQDSSPIFMCDILGYKNYITDLTDENASIQMMVSIADAINYMKLKNVGLSIFDKNEQLTKNLESLYPKDYWLDAAIVSDTIVFYPSPKNADIELTLEVKLLIMSLAAVGFLNTCCLPIKN